MTIAIMDIDDIGPIMSIGLTATGGFLVMLDREEAMIGIYAIGAIVTGIFWILALVGSEQARNEINLLDLERRRKAARYSATIAALLPFAFLLWPLVWVTYIAVCLAAWCRSISNDMRGKVDD